MTTLVAIVLTLWLVLTVANQFDYARSKLGSVFTFDVLGLIPVWTFFAPRPGTSDYRIFFRGRNDCDESVPWNELELSEPRKPWHFFWNPHKRHVKVLNDLVQAFLRFYYSAFTKNYDSTQLRAACMLNMAYLATLSLIEARARSLAMVSVQFAIIKEESSTPGVFEPVIVSLVHPINRDHD